MQSCMQSIHTGNGMAFFSSHVAVYFQIDNMFVEIMFVFVGTEPKFSTASLLW